PYLRERALDIQDVTKRVVRNLQGKAPKTFLALSESHILVAHNLTPSDTASMNRANVLGIATDLGSRTSHAAILARSLNIPADVEAVAANGAEGIGLYRTEFLYLNRTTLPTEDEQFETYRKVAERVRPDPLIIRTFDLGGDKLAPGTVDITDELNPFLGWRAIRLCLENIDIFKTQLRAILRASAVGNIKIMFPMISRLD